MLNTGFFSDFQRPSSQAVAQEALTLATVAGSGAFSAHYFTAVNPVGGAVFGTAFFITSGISGLILDKLFHNSPVEKILKLAIKMFASFAVAMVVTTFFSYKIALLSALHLSGTTAVVTYVSGLVINDLKQWF